MKKIIVALTIVGLFTHCTCKKEPWIELFNGKDLTGWTKKGGDATYQVIDGAIVGTSVAETPNTFLCTDEMYCDFILEVEFKVDDVLNSGIQIRSNSYADFENGRVHGYQVEIDPDTIRKRYWSGGIYDEARAGWLYELGDNEAARKAFKRGDWNKYRIEAIGDTIKTFVNGIAASFLVDNTTRKGFIGLQVHSIGNDSIKLGKTVSWKNIRIITDSLSVREYSTPSSAKMVVYQHNILTEQEKEEGWKLLFNGISTQGWRGAYRDSFPNKGWIIRDQALTVLSSDGAESQNGGDIVTLDEYKNFEFQTEFFFTKGANSGIKYYVTEKEQGNPWSAFGLEFQILDDINHPDAKLGRNGNRTIGSLYDLITADTSKIVNKGKWNHARIVSKDNHVEHYLNGKLVVSYQRGTPEFRKLVKLSKYADPKYNQNGPFGEWEKGRILLQDHGDRVSYRNIKVREL